MAVDPNIDSIIRQTYQSVGRTPDPEGYNYWVNQVQTGALTPDNLQEAIINAGREEVSNRLSSGETLDQIASSYNASVEGMAKLAYPSLYGGADSILKPAPPASTVSGGTLTPERARDLIERTMLTGVPTAEFNKYGGYDAVYKLAQQAGLKGSPRTGLIASAAPTIENTGTGNRSYAFDYSYSNHPVPITKEQFFESAVPREYIQYLPDYVDDYASLAALAIANDPENRNKTFDEIDWSFLKPQQTAQAAPPAPPALAQYDAVTREVNPETDTVQGQLKKILDEDDSPLMRRARAMALAQMAGRGLLNSSLAATAGYAAMIDKALPIAQQDAQTYFKQGLTNQDYRNQAELTNVNWKNKFLENSYVAQLDFWKQSNLLKQQHGYDLEKINLENKWKADLLSTEYGFKQALQDAELDNSLQQQYLSTYQDMLKHLNAVLVDPNADDEAKRAIVNNTVESINKLKDSMAAVGANIPDFDFSSYYVGDGTDAAG